jgi:hypothetical protein
VIRSVSTGRSVRRFSAALVLPILMAAGCGGQPTAAIPQPTQPTQPQATNGTPTVPPTVRTVPARPRNQPASEPAAGGSATITLDQTFMPFAAGRSWTYNVRSTANGKSDDGTVTWTVDAASADNTAVTVASDVGGQKHTVSNKVVKNADGTVTITSTTDGQTQTQTVKPEAGQQTDQAQGPGAGGAGQGMQGTADSITVPAGTFDAVKVVNQLPEGKGTITAWYAPDIGMVKQDIQATTDSGPVSSIMELAAYK